MKLDRLTLLMSLVVMAGCGTEWSEDEGLVGEAEGTLVEENALTENALTENALTQNALTQNALTENALTQNGLIGQNGLGSNGFTSKNGLGTNGLGTNGLGTNGLGTNGLGTNGLIGANGLNDDWEGIGGDPGFPNGLDDDWHGAGGDPGFPNGLDDDALRGKRPTGAAGMTPPAILDPGKRGARARQFLRYLVSCAFEPSQSLDFTWTDARGRERHERYRGALGIAPHWATGPLGEQGERMVSACIAARVNHYGVPVQISLRSHRAPLNVIGDDELEAFPAVEGAFWGNLWADPPQLFACHAGENAEHARDAMRVCAAGHVGPDGTLEGCGMIRIVGDCADACRSFDAEARSYRKCSDMTRGGPASNDVITTALP